MSFISPDYLDRAMPLTIDDRKEIRRQAWKLWFKDRRNLSLYIVVIVLVNVLAGLAWELIRLRVPQPGRWHWVVFGVIFIIALWTTILLLQRWRFAPLMWQVARKQGFDVCPKCGRWRREDDPPAENCPTCGAPREAINR